MVISVDLNSDMGEGFGPWKMGDDNALLSIITSANIACGFHAGDPDVMARTMAIAVANNVGIGVHPGFDDLRGFGRRRQVLSSDELRNLITYQLGAARAMAHAAGGGIRHFKLHGALANMAAEDAEMAEICYRAAIKIQPDIIIMVLAATAQEVAARAINCNWAGEIFADRAYNDDATLVDRALPGAVLHDASVAAKRILTMLREDAIIAESGKRIPAKIDTICLHGDTPEAVEMARELRKLLTKAGISLSRL